MWEKEAQSAAAVQINHPPPKHTPSATPPDTSSSWLLANNPSSSTPRLGLDRAVVVTGVSKGIGAAIARELAAKGCHVFGSVRRPGDAAALTDALGPAKFTPLVFDITDTVAFAAAVAVVDAALAGRTLFALVNNAGMHAGIDPAAAVTSDTLRTQLEVNLVAPIAVTQAFLPLLGTDRLRAGVPGRVVMMSSVYGNYAVPWNVRKKGGVEREREEREWIPVDRFFFLNLQKHTTHPYTNNTGRLLRLQIRLRRHFPVPAPRAGHLPHRRHHHAPGARAV